MPQPGEILLYRDYVFEDGSRANKLFVILNHVDLDAPCLVLKTTSQTKRYIDAKRGCNEKLKTFFVPSGHEACFQTATYIQLPQIIEIPTDSLLNGSFARTISIIGKLSDNCFAQLKGCVKGFRDDIVEQHWKLVFG